MSVHVAADELADAAAGLLDAPSSDRVVRHLAGCPLCQETAAGLRRVTEVLAAAPTPAMPAAVAARLERALRGEQARRAGARAAGGSRVAPEAAGWPRPTLGPLQLPPPPRRRLALVGLVAAATTALAGFGGYLLSASIGMNEPPVAIAAVDSDQLSRQAEAIRAARDPDAHVFSRAWDCARQVTTGEITGLATAVVDGREGLLVFTKTGPELRVTVVTGCEAGAPAPGPSTLVTR
ncbi:MAG: hypothetical protein ACLGIF_09620 [Actinomycetes bacterium]